MPPRQGGSSNDEAMKMSLPVDTPERIQAGPVAPPLRAGHVTERYVDGELVLYDAQRQRIHALNPTAAFVWLRCDGRHDETHIVADLAGLYPESCQAIRSDVPRVLSLLVSEGLLVPAHA